MQAEEKQHHPIREQERIDRCGVIVTEVGDMPSGESPLQSENMVIGLCLGGSAALDYNMEKREFLPHDAAIILPNNTLTYCSTSPDYRTLLIITSKTFYDKLINRASFIDYKKYYYRPACHLTDVQFMRIMDIARVLRTVSEADHYKRTEIMENLLDMLFYALTRYRGEEGVKSETETRNEQLFSRFYDLLTAHYNTQHEVIWYAGQLCLSPKYFSTVIRQTTNKSAAEWIAVVLVIEAKKLLRTRRDMTVQETAYELGFSDNASFCRFFRRETGMTPGEYREG